MYTQPLKSLGMQAGDIVGWKASLLDGGRDERDERYCVQQRKCAALRVSKRRGVQAVYPTCRLYCGSLEDADST